MNVTQSTAPEAETIIATPLTGRLPAVNPEQAATVAALASRGDLLDTETEYGHLTLRPTQARDDLPADTITLDYGAGRLIFQQTHGRGEPRIGDLAWHDLEGEARLLAWSLAHEPILNALSAALGLDIAPGSFTETAFDSIDLTWLDLHFSSAKQTTEWRGRLGLDRIAAQALASSEAWQFDPKIRAMRRARIQLTCSVTSAPIKLGLGQLRKLALGDVLLLGRRRDVLNSLRLRIPGNAANTTQSVTWGAEWSHGTLTLSRRLANDAFMPEEKAPDRSNPRQATESPSDPPNPATESPADTSQNENPAPPPEAETETAQNCADKPPETPLKDIPARVEVVIDTLQLTLGDFESLSPGQTLALQQSLDHARVSLQVNHAHFANGELVALGDALAVRITDIARDD